MAVSERSDFVKILETYNGKELPKVETDRLVLRQRTIDDVPDMFDYARPPFSSIRITS